MTRSRLLLGPIWSRPGRAWLDSKALWHYCLPKISGGLQVLEQGRNPDVMSATEDQMASLIQTYAARHAATVVPAASDGLEAKFDNHDLLGWIGSFFTWWKKIRPHAWQPAN